MKKRQKHKTRNLPDPILYWKIITDTKRHMDAIIRREQREGHTLLARSLGLYENGEWEYAARFTNKPHQVKAGQ